ncbi:MAG TPA: hypothetical protein VN840_19455 [Streptosporangiaceae bacterium]|nr:hypothetical protein [Streptosporangiaceae bacterium]
MTVLAASQSVISQPGTVAFLVVFGMAVMLFFVFRSMSRHLRKLNDAARAADAAGATAEPGGVHDAPTTASQNGSAGGH